MKSTVNHDPTAAVGAARRERGSALVLTLGILALLLISAMVFVFTANTEREAAAVNADVAKARLLAKAKMELAMAQLHYASQQYQAAYGFHQPYPGTGRYVQPPANPRIMRAGSGNWQYIWYLASTWANLYNDDLDAPFHLDLGFDYTPTTATDMAGSPSWQPFVDSDGKIVGRATYLIVDESGKLDPNALINPDVIPSVGGVSYGWSGIDEGDEVRYGYIPAEIDIGAALLGPNNLNLGVTTTDASYFKDRRHATTPPWQSWRQMFAANYGGNPLINKASASVTNDVLAMKTVLFPRSFDKEAFHSGGTDYQRFSVGTFDWNFPGIPLTPPDYGPEYTARVNSLIGLANPWNGSNSSSAIPWLSAMTGAGTIPDADLRKQVAANLIDYNDADSAATTDFVGPDYTANPIASGTYCGLEKVAYINEVHIQVLENADLTDPSNPVYDHDFTVHVELVNIYDTNFTNGVLELHIQFSGQAGTSPTAAGPIVSATNAGIALRWSGISCAANSYTASAAMSASFTYAGVSSEAAVTITGMAARLSLGGDLVDAAIINQTGTDDRSQTLSPGPDFNFNFAVDDPRCNLHPAFWIYSTGASTIGNRNNQATAQGNPSAAAASYPNGRDIETVGDVAIGPSTAYIRNGPMMSLWELGAIHRGEPWRTINLQAFNDNPATATYANGDAILLDQCCVGPEKRAIGRFNVNSPVPFAWIAMLHGIAVGTGYDHSVSAGGGAADAELLSNPMIVSLINSILDTNGAVAGSPFKSRGQLATAAAVVDRSAVATRHNTDAAREEIIGKIANLLTTRQNYFRVLVTAQAVKDLGDVPQNLPVASRQKSWQEMGSGRWVDVLAEVKQMAIVRRDAHTNVFVVEQVENLE